MYTGCVKPEQCPWGMFCNTESKTCEYKLCSNQLANGTLAHEASTSYTGLMNTLGHTAVASCNKGFVADHPDDLAVLVMDGFEVPGEFGECHSRVA